MNSWIYAAVILAIGASAIGLAVGGLILHRVAGHTGAPKPAIVWLLFVLLATSLGTLLEQSRILVFRLSYDALIEPGIFHSVYGAAWNVVSSKVLLAVAIVVGAAVKLGIYCNRTDATVTRWVALAVILTLGAWAFLAYLIEAMTQ